MIQSMNLPICTSSIRPYGSWDKLHDVLKHLGLDGIEGIVDPEDIDTSFPASMLCGYHLIFYADWLDFYRNNKKELLRKFGSMELVNMIYHGTEPEDMIKMFRDDLYFAISLKAPYVVFHVSDVSMEEGYTYQWLHTDKEVLDGAIDFINELLQDIEPTFEFLVENQWWPGFTFTDPEKTEYLLSGIKYPKKGIMLDTGHLLNTNSKIRTQSEGISYILEMVKLHGKLKDEVKGIHFHQSISGDYVRKNTGNLPEGFPAEFFTEFARNYAHIQMIDRHRPWTDPDCIRILDEVRPMYLTHELSASDKRSQLTALKIQLNTIERGFGRNR